MIVDDGEGPGIGVVDLALVVGQPVFDQLIFHAVIGERPGGVEAERTQVACQHFHRCNTAILDGLDEFGAGGEGEIVAAPETQALGIGEVVNAGGAGG